MTERERLIEILSKKIYPREGADPAEVVADFLVDEGIIVPPCKVGDIVWIVYDNYVTTAEVLAFYYDRTGGMCDLKINTKEETAASCKTVINKDYVFSDIYKTREEAEKALKEREENA